MLYLERLPRSRPSTSTSKSKSGSKPRTRFFDVRSEFRHRNQLQGQDRRINGGRSRDICALNRKSLRWGNTDRSLTRPHMPFWPLAPNPSFQERAMRYPRVFLLSLLICVSSHSQAATSALPSQYFRLLEAGAKQVEQRLAAEPAADLEKLEARPGWRHFP
jgi:hypothetical protein